MVIGVLALQGDVDEHIAALQRLGFDSGSVQAIPVKTIADLARVDGLIIPGGESTTVMKLLERFGLGKPIVERVRAGMPLWGTCMGMIVVAKDVAGLDQPTLGLLDITVRRNAFGRQNDSAKIDLEIPAIGATTKSGAAAETGAVAENNATSFPGIFIRAPWIERAGPDVELLAERDGHGVMVRQGDILGTSFHPELSGDDRIHRYFLEMVQARSAHHTPAFAYPAPAPARPAPGDPQGKL